MGHIFTYMPVFLVKNVSLETFLDVFTRNMPSKTLTKMNSTQVIYNKRFLVTKYMVTHEMFPGNLENVSCEMPDPKDFT